MFFPKIRFYFFYAASRRAQAVCLSATTFADDHGPDTWVLQPRLVLDLQSHAPIVGDRGRAGADDECRDVAWVDLQPRAFRDGKCQHRLRQAVGVDGRDAG